MRRCRTCEREQPSQRFHGVADTCKACIAAAERERREQGRLNRATVELTSGRSLAIRWHNVDEGRVTLAIVDSRGVAASVVTFSASKLEDVQAALERVRCDMR